MNKWLVPFLVSCCMTLGMLVWAIYETAGNAQHAFLEKEIVAQSLRTEQDEAIQRDFQNRIEDFQVQLAYIRADINQILKEVKK